MKTSRSLFLFGSLLVLTISLHAQESITGKWEGAMKVLRTEIEIRITLPEQGISETATLDVLSQGAYGLKINSVELAGNKINMDCDTIGLSFSGIIEGDTMYGKWSQHGIKGKFGLARKVGSDTPGFPFPLKELSIPIDDFSIAGSLNLPEGEGPFPCILLISGSGQQDRDENILGFKVFRELAIELNSQGFAVFRFDDRGTGSSGGFHDSLTSADFMHDADIILDSLSGRGELIPGKIGILGHSEGGIIAANLAAQRKDLSFIIMMAGPTLPGKDIILLQTKYIMEAGGARAEDVENEMALSESIFELMAIENWDSIHQLFQAESMQSWKSLPRAARKQYDSAEEFATYVADVKVKAMQSAWYRYFIAYDPMDDLLNVNCPTLAVFGGKDTQVPATENIGALEQKGLLSEDSSIELRLIPEANHLFQKAGSGSPNEYSSLERSFDEAYLVALREWLSEMK